MAATSEHKIPSNTELADILRDVAAAYQIKDEGKYRFQIIAYQRAADGIEKLSSEVKDYFDDGKLTEIPGVGNSIAAHIQELFEKGKSKHFVEMIDTLPRAVFELLKVPGLGPKKAYRLALEFKLPDKSPLQKLLEAAKSGEISTLEGFGKESEKDIIESIEEYLIKPPERVLLSEATEISESLTKWLSSVKGVKAVNTLGSLRRQASTVGDIDLSVSATDASLVFDRLVSFDGVLRTIERGEHSCSVLLPGNIQVDVMVQPPEAYGSLLQHFTGSKHHNIALREFALKKGLSLSEYGIKSKSGGGTKFKQSTYSEPLSMFQFKKEEDFYNALGLPWIPPELREGRGEIQSAQEGTLPELITLSDVKGDLQMHSSFDIETSHDVGASSMIELAQSAIEKGYEYIALTEHNPSQKGHTEKRTMDLLLKKREVIAQLNDHLVKTVKGRVFKVFNSLEVDILPSGRLAVSDNALEILDFALVSIHSSFKQNKDLTTKRILDALSHPNVKIFAHPTARLLNKRESVSLDWDLIFDFCVKHDKWIEINADPHRLDLPDVLVKDAVKNGVKMTLGTDAHHIDGLANMKYGVSVARRGWATANDIINTKSLRQFQALLR